MDTAGNSSRDRGDSKSSLRAEGGEDARGMEARAIPEGVARLGRFATVIDDALAKRSRPRTWLAEQTGIPYSTLVDHLRRDDPKLRLADLFAIIRVLNLDLTDFLELSEGDRQKHLSWKKIEEEEDLRNLLARITELVALIQKKLE